MGDHAEPSDPRGGTRDFSTAMLERTKASTMQLLLRMLQLIQLFCVQKQFVVLSVVMERLFPSRILLEGKKPASFVEGPIVVESADDPFEDLDEILGDYANTGKRITGDEIMKSRCTTVRIDVQQEPNLESLTRTFRRVYVCLGALKQGFRACGKEILGLDWCFMSSPWPCQILIAVEVDTNNEIYPVAHAIVEAEIKASWCWFLNLLREELGHVGNPEKPYWLKNVEVDQGLKMEGLEFIEDQGL
nr:transposase, mutator type [Tanacetum cinerariifolium]